MAERENTGNTIPSNALKDLNDNTIILDEWTNSRSDYTQDRFGVKFKTRYKILNDLQTSINSIQSGSFLPLSGGTLTGPLTGTDITAKTSLTVGIAKATSSTAGLNFDKPLLINNVAALKVGDSGVSSAGLSITNFDDPNQTSCFFTTTTGVTGNPAITVSNGIQVRRGSTSRSAIAWNPNSNQAFSGRFNGTTWEWCELITTANIANYQSGLGINQTWQDVTTARQSNVKYTNETGKPIFVAITKTGDAGVVGYFYIDDVVVGINTSGTGAEQVSAVVPSGSVYYYTSKNIATWAELR